MSNFALIFISLKLLFGFLLAFLAILAWARTRETPWLFIITGTLIRYLELVYSILSELNIFSPAWGSAGDVPVLEMLLTLLPLLFYIAGFFLFLMKKRNY